MNPDPDLDGLSAVEFERLSTLLRAGLGSSAANAACEVLKRAQDYLVVRVGASRDHPALVAKLAGPEAQLACPFEATAALNRLIRNHGGIPTYEVLAAGEANGLRYLIATQVRGVPWSTLHRPVDGPEFADLRRQLGSVVATMHALRFASFGELQSDGRPTPAGVYSNALSSRAARRLANPVHRDLFLEVMAAHQSSFDQCDQPVLAHEDLNPGNLLIERQSDRWILSGIVDFESAWAGSAHSDLARLELWRMADEAFWAGYRERSTLIDRPPELTLLHQLLWCLEYASSTSAHQSDTARVCRALGIAPVVFGS